MPVRIRNRNDTATRELRDIVVVCLCRKVLIQNTFVIHTAQPSEIFLLVLAGMLVGTVIILVDQPLSVIRRRICDKTCRIAQSDHPVPVGCAHGDTDGLQPVLCGRMRCQIRFDHLFILCQCRRILIVILCQHRILDLAGAACAEDLTPHARIRQLVDTRIVSAPFQLLKLVSIHLLDVGTILLDQIRHVDQRACFVKVRYGCFGVDHIRIVVVGDHQCHILAGITGTGYRIGDLQCHTGSLRDRRTNRRLTPVTVLTVRIVILKGNGRSVISTVCLCAVTFCCSLRVSCASRISGCRVTAATAGQRTCQQCSHCKQS